MKPAFFRLPSASTVLLACVRMQMRGVVMADCRKQNVRKRSRVGEQRARSVGLLLCLPLGAAVPASAQDIPPAAATRILPTIARHGMSMASDVFIDANTVSVTQRAIREQTSEIFRRPRPAGTQDWGDQLRRSLETAQDGYVTGRFRGQLLEANTRMAGIIIGGGLGAIGGPAGVAVGAQLGDRGAALFVEHVLGDPVGQMRDKYATQVRTIIASAVGQAHAGAQAELQELAASGNVTAFAQRLSQIADTALDQQVVADLGDTPETREALIRDVANSQAAALQIMQMQVTTEAVAAARADVQVFRREFRRFAADTTERLANLQAATEDLAEHQREMAEELRNLSTTVTATQSDVRFLIEASVGRMPLPQQIQALRRGIPQGLGEAERERLAKRLEAVLRVQQTGTYVGMVGDIGQFALALGPRLGIQPDSQTHRDLTYLVDNVHKAQQFLGIVSAFITPGGGFMAALPGLTALLGAGGAPGAQMPPGLSEGLQQIQQSLAQIHVKLDQVLELQRDTLSRLDNMRLQMTALGDEIRSRLEVIEQQGETILEAVMGAANRAFGSCETIARSMSRPIAPQISPLTLQQRSNLFIQYQSQFSNCLSWLNASVMLPNSGAVGSSPYYISLMFRDTTGADGLTSREAAYRSLADYTYALHATLPSQDGNDSFALGCQRRAFLALTIAPAFFAAVPTPRYIVCPDRPFEQDDPADLPVTQWMPANGDREMVVWRLTDAPLNLQTVNRMADIVLRLGEWRSVMRLDGGTRVVMTPQQAFGADGILPEAGLWQEEHEELVRYFGDVLDTAIARETILAGALLSNWIADQIFIVPDPERLREGFSFQWNRVQYLSGAPDWDISKPPTAFGQGAAPRSAMRAWQTLITAQDNPRIRESIGAWFASAGGSDSQRLQPVSVVDAVRLLFGYDFPATEVPEEQHLLAGAGAEGRRAALRQRLGEIGLNAVSSPTADEREFLREISWMIAFNRNSTGPLYDLACRSRRAEEQVAKSQGGSPERRDPDRLRGTTDAQRLAYHRALRGELNGAYAYHIAACLTQWSDFARENALRFAVLRRLEAMQRRDALERYARALESNDNGLMLSQVILPNWPVARHSELGWVVRMRSADGRLVHVPLPSAEDLRTTEVVRTPMQQSLLQSRHAIAQHRVLNMPLSSANPPLPGNDLERQALARAMAFSLTQPGRR